MNKKYVSTGVVYANISASFYGEFLEELFRWVKKLPGNPEPKKDGIILAVWFIKAYALMTIRVGNPAADKIHGRTRNATEKVTRVLVHKLVHSFQLRNLLAKKYGGGVFNTKLITAGSGFQDEYVDEIFALVYAIYHNYKEGGIFYKYKGSGKNGQATFPEVLIRELDKFQKQVKQLHPKSRRENRYISYVIKNGIGNLKY